MDDSLIQAVRIRAKNACESCRMPSRLYPTVPFPIDHIVALQHGGSSTLGNLALACLHCNSHKGPNISGLDPKTRKLTKLFHPRRHKWSHHFAWNGPILVGKTAVGRATVAVLAINDPDFVAVRRAIIEEGQFHLLR